MNLASVIITSSATFSSIVLINEVSVVTVISKTFRFEKRLQYYFQSFRPRVLFCGKYDDGCLQNKQRINVLFVMI